MFVFVLAVDQQGHAQCDVGHFQVAKFDFPNLLRAVWQPCLQPEQLAVHLLVVEEVPALIPTVVVPAVWVLVVVEAAVAVVAAAVRVVLVEVAVIVSVV